jgi:transmembrane sensor
MKYQHYQFRDFMLDEGFQKWVLEPESAAVFWPDYLLRYPEKEAEITRARQAVLALHLAGGRKERSRRPAARPAPHPDHEQAVWLEVSQAIAAPAAARVGRGGLPAGRVIPMWRQAWPRMAAAGLVLLALGGLFWLRYQQPPETLAYQTAFGQVRQVTLPDGSVVTLNANSRLTFARQWEGGQDREVRLAGEAFFAVRPAKAARKFRVLLSGGTRVEVLGTAFTVTNRPHLTRVVLSHGQVRVGLAASGQDPAPGSTLLMAPGEVVEVDARRRKLTRSQVAQPAAYAAFVQDKIEFSDSPLSEVARVLQDNYGYKVTFVPASLARKRFTSSNPSDRVDLLLFAIEKSFNLQVRRKGRHITFLDPGN